MYDISFNGIKAWDKGIAVATRPSIPAPQKRGDFVDVAGLDGSLLVSDGTYENIEIEIEMNFVRAPHWIGNAYREAKNWLNGSGELILGDDSDVHYRVKLCQISDMDRRTRNGVDLEVTFVCDPFVYMNAGKNKLPVSEVLQNPYYLSKPIYYIRGEGECELTVNGNTMTALVGQNLVIDTEKMMSYRENGDLQNTAVTGDYEGLYLVSGSNSIEITNGFNLLVRPNWRSL